MLRLQLKEQNMTKTTLIAATLFSALTVAAVAQSPAPASETRAQVKAETAEAVRNGDITWGEQGRKLNEIYPKRYAPKPSSPGETRAEVKADLARASQDGDLPRGDLDVTDRQTDPKRFPPQATEPGLTRAQVEAETRAAIRAGDVQFGDSSKTLAEEDPPRYEGAPSTPPKLSLNHHVHAATRGASATMIGN
jgi:hypothetical protein